MNFRERSMNERRGYSERQKTCREIYEEDRYATDIIEEQKRMLQVKRYQVSSMVSNNFLLNAFGMKDPVTIVSKTYSFFLSMFLNGKEEKFTKFLSEKMNYSELSFEEIEYIFSRFITDAFSQGESFFDIAVRINEQVINLAHLKNEEAVFSGVSEIFMPYIERYINMFNPRVKEPEVEENTSTKEEKKNVEKKVEEKESTDEEKKEDSEEEAIEPYIVS